MLSPQIISKETAILIEIEGLFCTIVLGWGGTKEEENTMLGKNKKQKTRQK